MDWFGLAWFGLVCVGIFYRNEANACASTQRNTLHGRNTFHIGRVSLLFIAFCFWRLYQAKWSELLTTKEQNETIRSRRLYCVRYILCK